MKKLELFTAVLLFLSCSEKPISLFNGENFQGWEGDTINTWRIEEGVIVAGDTSTRAPRNDFICTTTSFDDFILQFDFKLEGTEGFVNAGVQVRSERIEDPPHEMRGYQVDIGKGFYGALYDESRRNVVLVRPDSALIARTVNIGEWNTYKVIADGPSMKLFINGTQTVDYTETDPNIPLEGVIGPQIHGGGKVKISYRNISIVEL